SEEVRAQVDRGLQDSWRPPRESVDSELAAYRGSWFQGFQERWPTTLGIQTAGFVFLILGRVAGLMLVGMALFKLGFFSGERSPRTYAALVAAALLVGVPVILYGVRRNFAENWDFLYEISVGGQFNYWGSIVVSLGWVGLVMLACPQPWLRFITRPLAAVGRM